MKFGKEFFVMKKDELENTKKVGGGGITAKNSRILAKNSSYPADFDKNCKNSQNLENVQNNCKNSTNKNKGENTIKNAQNVDIENLEFKNGFTNKILSNNDLDNTNKKLNNTKENFENAHITYNECTTKTTCAKKVGNIMSIDNKNKNENNKVNVSQVSHNENEKNCACVASVGCEQNHGEKKVAKCGYENSEEFGRRNCEAGCANDIKSNDIKVNRDEQAEAKVQNAFTAKLCVCLFAIVACFAFALGFCFASLSGSSASNTFSVAADFGGGEGSASNPYLINSLANLKSLATGCNNGYSYTDKYFKLTADITIGGTDLSSWTPIASSSSSRYFSGIFDGDDHTITFQGSVSKSVSDTAYYGLLFGYVKGNGTTTAAATNGIVKNVNIVLDDNGTTATDEFKVTFAYSSGTLYFGGVVGYSNAGIVDNCNISGSSLTVSSTSRSYGYIGGIVGECSTVLNCEFNTNFTSGFGWSIGGIVASTTNVDNCKFFGDFQASGIMQSCGAICGESWESNSMVQNCKVVGKVNITRSDATAAQGAGVIMGYTEGSIANCYAKVEENSTIVVAGMGATRCGLIAGFSRNTINNCHVEANMQTFSCADANNSVWIGLVCGSSGTISNCLVNATIGTVSSGTAFSFNSPSGTIKNCIMIADIETLTASSGSYLIGSIYVTAYNCVAITKVGGVGTTYQISNSNAGTTADGMIYDATNGLYSVAWNSNSVLVNELKQTSTYTSGTANFAWNTAGGTTGGTAWSFAPTYGSETGVWFIAGQENDGFPLLKQFYVPSIISVTINVTTNLGGSTTGSGTTGSMGSASAGGTAGAVNKFILYKLDGLGNVVNQYVVESGSTIQFESTACDAFTIMINYKLYMVTTIDGENALQKTFTPSENKTINISITAPANVNNWIVI